MKCPKCKSENDNNALTCVKCGFKLKIKCPHCNSFNPIGAKTCQNCGKTILKICPECKAVNFATAKVCRKCATPFPVINDKPKEQTDKLEKATSVAIELINISSIKTNVKSAEIATKIINKFYQVFAKSAKAKDVKALKINESTLVVRFDNAPSFIDSVNKAIEFTELLDETLTEVSELLERKLKISYKTRYLCTTCQPIQKKEILSAISLGVVNDVIFSEDIYVVLKDKLPFKELENTTGEKFYKFLNQNNPETIVTEMPKTPDTTLRTTLMNDLIKQIEIAKYGFIACLNGPLGVGKSNVFSLLRMAFDEDNSRLWLLGQCSLQAKNSPLFFFRDLLRNLFDIPAFNIDIETTKKRVYTYLADKLNLVDETFVKNLFGILFGDDEKLQKPLYDNKNTTYQTIATLFRALLNKGPAVLQIEDIENIDGFSLEIIRNLFNEGILKCNLKILITSNINITIQQFLASPAINKDNCAFVQFPPMSKQEIDDFITKAIGVREELGANTLNYIYEKSQGLPVFIDNFINLLLEMGLIKFENAYSNKVIVSPDIIKMTFPNTIEELIQLRLTNISNSRPEAFKALYYASILGFKFLPAVVQNILQVNDESFEEIRKFLTMNNFITPFDTYNYTFRNRTVWQVVRNLQLNPDNKVTGVTSAMKTLLQLTMPDMATVIDNLINVSVAKPEILPQIELASKDAYIIGDDYSYVYHKAFLLDAVNSSELENKNEVALSIKEELLNLTYMTFPEIAIKYADELVSYYEPIDTAKTIDILGITTIAFELTGNYLAAVECVNKALEKIDANSNQLAAMLLNYSKLNSILQLGRYEELINIIRNDILTVIDLHKANRLNETTSLDETQINSIELESKYLYALALALQGSLTCTEATQNLYACANSMMNTEYTLKSQLVDGIYKLILGATDEVQNILEATKEVIPQTKDASFNTLIWLILKNFAKFLQGDYSSIVDELLMMSNFAQNIKKYALEPVIKGLLVKIALREGKVEPAQKLAYEEYYKCANNQWALGALINWYMYCDISIYREKYEDAMKIAQNALDVAEKANINNAFFTALIKLKLAEIYSLRNDLDMAIINIKEAENLASMNNYTYIKAHLGIIYYDILLKQITHNSSLKADNIKLINKYLTISQEAVQKLQNTELLMKLKQLTDGITKFAQENNITLI